MPARLELPVPISANRYWRHARGITFRSKEADIYRREVAFRAAAQTGCWHPMQCEVRVVYTYHPKARKKETSAPLRRLDLGNVEKVASDALNGIAWLDDKQLVDIHLVLGEPVKDGSLIVEWEAA